MRTPSPLPTGDSTHSRTRRWSRTALSCAFLVLLTGFSATWVSAGRDHPARVSFMDGRAAYETSGDVDWNEVTVNLPLVSGDRIMGHSDSRIGVELGDGNFVRISGETDVLFPELSRKKTILKLHVGDLILRVADASRIQVDLDQASVKIRKKGLYRFQIDPEGSVRLVVHRGRAEVSSRHGKERVETGQELRLDARQIGIQALVRDLDEFELWSGRRDAAMVSSLSAGYLGGVDFPGVESLDQYGDWVQAGSFGHVWVPDASVGWAPFRYGRWCYLSSGLTWVSHEPWGWLPYHYGRWIHYGPMNRWAWVPGGFNRWRPALVDFYWGGDYFGWAPRGYYGRGIGGGSPTTVVQNNTLRNWNPRDRSNGLTVIHRNDLGREPTRTRVLASGDIVGGLRQGLPRELRRSRVWNRNSVSPRTVRASRLASRSTTNPREGVVGSGPRRPSVSRNDTAGSRVRVQSPRDTQGRFASSIDRTRSMSRRSFRSDSSNRTFSRTTPGSRGSFSNRSSRNASRPSVWSSRRSRPATSPTISGPSGRSSSRSVYRTPNPSMPTVRSNPTYRSPAPSFSRSASPRVQSPPRQSGSSRAGSSSRATTRSRN